MRYGIGSRAMALACVVAAAGSASAATLDVSASVGARAASVRFAVSGNTLVVTLTNTYGGDANVPIDMLTAVFFDVSGSALSLTRTSALLNAGSDVININPAPQPAGGVVGGEWAYKSSLGGAPHGAAYGISSTGVGLFGPGDLFPGPDLDPPASPNGLNYGITTLTDTGANNNGGASVPLIRNSVVFTLTGLPSGFDPMARISNVNFQYGTDLAEPNLQVPAPGAGLGAMLGLGAFAARRRRR